MFKYLFGLLAALSLTLAVPVAAQDNLPDMYVNPPDCAVSTLAGCAGSQWGNLAYVYDGDSLLDCSNGGGSTRVLCQNVEGTWEPVLPAHKVRAPTMSICGDVNAIDNSTLYLSPEPGLQADMTIGCDIADTGHAAVADANEAFFYDQAFAIVGMFCRQSADAGADIVYKLVTGATPSDTVPSVTCTIPDNDLSCLAEVATTTNIAADTLMALSATSTGTIGDIDVRCDIDIVFP